jgi:outer membrane autotransporter protein
MLSNDLRYSSFVDSWRERARSGPLGRTVAAGALLAVSGLPVTGWAQSLNDAVAAQLEVSGGLECGVLLGGDTGNLSSLSGELLNICTRGVPASGAGGASGGGGGAATPSTLPSVLDDRMSDSAEAARSQSASGDSKQSSVEWGNGIGTFVSVEYENLERDVTTFEDGYDSDMVRVTLGGDYRLSDRAVAGLAVDGFGHHGDYDAGGDFEDYSIGVLAFGSLTPLDAVSVDITAGYAHNFYDRTRVASFTQLDSGGAVDFTTSGDSRSDFDADGFHAAALASYDFQIENFTLSPQAGVEFRHVEFESYKESGNTGLELDFRRDDQTWLQSRVGALVSAAFSTQIGVVIPHASFDYKHEFENDQRKVEASFVGDARGASFRYETEDPDRDFFLVGGGASIVLARGIQAFAAYRGMVGHSFYDSHAVTVGLRGEL